jgi:hypothetical protein
MAPVEALEKELGVAIFAVELHARGRGCKILGFRQPAAHTRRHDFVSFLLVCKQIFMCFFKAGNQGFHILGLLFNHIAAQRNDVHNQARRLFR